jgi:hypothetical protein
MSSSLGRTDKSILKLQDIVDKDLDKKGRSADYVHPCADEMTKKFILSGADNSPQEPYDGSCRKADARNGNGHPQPLEEKGETVHELCQIIRPHTGTISLSPALVENEPFLRPCGNALENKIATHALGVLYR